MALQDFDCPQFVDFTSGDAFNIHDGADFCFEHGVVGEQDLRMFDTVTSDDKRDSGEMERLFSVLKNSTNTALAHTEQIKNLITPIKNETSNKMKAEASEQVKQQTESPKLPKSPCKRENKENMIEPSSVDSAVFSAIEVAVAALKIEQTATSTAKTITMTTSSASVTAVKSGNKSGKPTLTPLRNRTNSNTPKSTGTKPVVDSKSSKIVKQPTPTTTSGHGQSLMKKTIAKVTAAFKQTKSNSITATMSDHASLRDKLTSSKKQKNANSYVKIDGPLKVEYSQKIVPTDMNSSSNRRCSSVPRTLKEKQALAKSGIVTDLANNVPAVATVAPPNVTATLGEKIQNFFSSSSSSMSRHRPTTTTTAKQMPATKPAFKPATNASFTLNQSKTKAKPQPPPPTYAVDRRRSRSCNESIAANRERMSRASRNASIESNRTAANNNKTHNLLSDSEAQPESNKLNGTIIVQQSSFRHKSNERSQLLPLYQGLKFIPKTSNTQYSLPKTQPADDVLKTRPLFLQKKEFRSTIQTSTFKPGVQLESFKSNRAANTSGTAKPAGNQVAKSYSFKQSHLNQSSSSSFPIKAKPNANSSLLTGAKSDVLNGTVTLSGGGGGGGALDNTQESVIAPKTLNGSGSSSTRNISMNSSMASARPRKKSEQTMMPLGNSSFLHTELRAQKRQEFEQQMKEKERIVANIKRDMEMEKLRKLDEEIQKIRAQNTFRSRPIKHFRPVEIKPSTKLLTDPRSPCPGLSTSRTTSRTNLSSMRHASTSNLASTSNNFSNLSSTSNALIDSHNVVIIKNSHSNLGEYKKNRPIRMSCDDIRMEQSK